MDAIPKRVKANVLIARQTVRRAIAAAEILMNIFGIDIGGTKCAVSRLLDDGMIVEESRFKTTEASATLAKVTEELDQLGVGPNPLFGVACGSPLDPVRGRILSPPNLEGWDSVPVRDVLTRRYGGRVYLMNDANACALAEWWFGAGRGCRNMVFLTAGTGMGAGLILNGRLYKGASEDAGEVGHWRLSSKGPAGYGKAGSFEGFCSGGGIARLARLRLSAKGEPLPGWARSEKDISAKSIAAAARRGDAAAAGIMEEAGRRLGQAIALLLDVLNPERMIIGGIYPRCSDLMAPAMHAIAREEALPSTYECCAILPAALGDTIGSHGAIAAAMHGANIRPAGRTPA